MNDPKLTKQLFDWLANDHSSREKIIEGATILLKINRNRGLYERIIRNPLKHVAKVEYELKKHANIRKEGMNIEDVMALNNEIMPKINHAVYKTEDDPENLPLEKDEESGTIVISKGIRPDHDKLPADIQAIWPANAERWKKIKATFELLKTLEAPCDRYENLKVLKEAWYKYKAEMARYDEYQADAGTGDGDSHEKSESDKQMIDYAQSYISRYLPQLLELVHEASEPDFTDEQKEKLEDLRVKIQDRVNILLKGGVQLTDQRKDDLVKCDIAIELPTDDAEGDKSE